MAKAKTAQQIVQEILGPQIAASNQAYRNKGASANAAYAAAAEMQQGVAPAIEQTYAAATAREAVMAKGFAAGQQASESAAADASNSLLAQNNSPQQVKASGAGNILATLGGLSASGLNREGAAFSSAAQWLPTQSRNLGIDAVKAAGLEGITARGALEVQRPGLVSQARSQLADAQAKQEALRQNEIALRAELGDTAFDQNITVERLKNDRARIEISKIQGDRNFNLSLERLGIQDAQLRLNAAKLEAQLRNQGKPQKGGFTAKQVRDLKADAGAIARNSFQGVKDEFGEVVAPQIGYQEAVKMALDEGIPLTIAQTALNRYYQTGVRGRPRRSFQERQAAKRQAAAKAAKGR